MDLDVAAEGLRGGLLQLDAIGGAEPLVTPGDGVLAVAMGVAAERSIATGEPVRVADVLAEARA